MNSKKQVFKDNLNGGIIPAFWMHWETQSSSECATTKVSPNHNTVKLTNISTCYVNIISFSGYGCQETVLTGLTLVICFCFNCRAQLSSSFFNDTSYVFFSDCYLTVL